MTKGLPMSYGSVARVLLVLSVAGSALLLAARTHAQEGEPARHEKEGPPPLASIVISLKLDPAITRSQYMGDRWVSPPVYTSTIQPGDRATVEAGVRGVDAAGRQVPIEPRWSPSDPAMVSVTPADGRVVKITVRGAGESRLRVSSGGVSRDLTVKAVSKNGGTQVEITQDAPLRIAEAEGKAALGSGEVAEGLPHESILKDPKERRSYAGGAVWRQPEGDVGGRGRRAGRAGRKDALTGGKTLLSADEMRTALAALQTDFRTKKTEGRKQLAERNKKEGEAFLAENKTKEGVVALESGLQYKVLKAGEGPKPGALDRVTYHYRGTFIDGREFDSSFKRGNPATMAVNRAIRGRFEGLQLMPVGSKWQLFVPPSLAYGKRGGAPRSGIGPNTTLVFEVELLSIEGGPRSAGKTESGATRAAREFSPTP
jgi:FKBP-type peptidyl-prolyl cis-trans isomerase